MVVDLARNVFVLIWLPQAATFAHIHGVKSSIKSRFAIAMFLPLVACTGYSEQLRRRARRANVAGIAAKRACRTVVVTF